jgi:hypothetical protein
MRVDSSTYAFDYRKKLSQKANRFAVLGDSQHSSRSASRPVSTISLHVAHRCQAPVHDFIDMCCAKPKVAAGILVDGRIGLAELALRNRSPEGHSVPTYEGG